MSVATSMPYGAVRLLWQRDRRMRLSWSRALVTSEWHSARADAAHHECPEWECYYTLYARWHVPVRRGNVSSSGDEKAIADNAAKPIDGDRFKVLLHCPSI